MLRRGVGYKVWTGGVFYSQFYNLSGRYWFLVSL